MQFGVLTQAGVDPETVKIYQGFAQEIDNLEILAHAEVEQLRRETMPPYVDAKVHKRLSDAAVAIQTYTDKLTALDKGELAQLRAQIPTEPECSELQENTQTAKDLFVLQSLGAEVLNDLLKLRLVYLDALEANTVGVIMAIERDPMNRGIRALQPDDLARGRAVRGLTAAPEIARKIERLELLRRTHASRIATALTRLRRVGWRPPDALEEMAGIRQTSESNG
jgi:hypothetical protein